VNLWRKDWKFSKSYASKQVGGGVLLDLCHEIDLANLLFSPLILNDVSCLDHKKFNDIDFISLITFTNSNNLIGTVSMDYLSPINRRKLIVKGLDYIDEIDFLSGTYKRTTSNSILIKEFPHERNQMFIDSMNIFIQNVLEKENFFLAIPSLDRIKSSSVLIKNAWQKRIFVGSVEGEMS
jgi:predicted dehydrogenase